MKDGDDRNAARMPGEVLGLGLNIVLAGFLFGFLGHWIGGKVGAQDGLTLLGGFIGAAAGFWSLYVHLIVRPAEERNEHREKKSG